MSYLDEEALPSVVRTVKIALLNSDLPLIYGNEDIKVENNSIFCGIDIFASVFFMLTRWEEYVCRFTDCHQRFTAAQSLASRFGFLHRPVVDEYCALLTALLRYMGFNDIHPKHSFSIIPSHDVDFLTYPIVKSLRTAVGDVMRGWHVRRAWGRINNLLFRHPYNTFSWLMDLSESFNLQSRFYFMAALPNAHLRDTVFYLRHPLFKKVVNEIITRGHVVGFHPGYDTFCSPSLWNKEKNMLEQSCGCTVYEGRQHFLRMNVPTTLRIWNNNEMLIDSTLGYADEEGYRCGTGRDFPIFDFLERKETALRERPLIVMDGTLHNYRKYNMEQAQRVLRHYVDMSRKYQSPLTLLFHNSSFDILSWPGYRELYKDTLHYAKG
jgi:polysaccharide deacetylase